MDVIAIFAVIAGIVFLGYLAEIIFEKTKIPDVLLLIGVGIGIGTYLDWIGPEAFGEGAKLFSTFALVFILFQGALSLEFKTLLRSLSSTFNLTVLSFLLTSTVVSLVSYILFNYVMGFQADIFLTLLVGFILGGTSSAVVIPIVSNVDIREKYGLVLTLESAISDVLCIIGTVTILQILETQQVVASKIFNTVLSSFALALVVGVVFGIIWLAILHKNEEIAKSYMLTVAAVIALYAFVESDLVGASGAIAALSFGLVLGNSKLLLQIASNKSRLTNDDAGEKQSIGFHNVLSSSARNFYAEISFFVKTCFFVYLGILIDFSNPYVFVYGGLLTLAMFIIRPIAVRTVFFKSKPEPREIALLEALIPKGLAAAVLAGIAVQSGFLGDLAGVFVNLILSVIFLSILLTSLLVFFAERGWFTGFMPFLYKDDDSKK